MSAGATALEVRPAAAADLPALGVLERQGFSDPWSRGLLAEELRQPGSLVLVALQGPDTVGYAAFRRAADEAELLRVAVSPERRGQGIGRALVHSGLDRLGRGGVARCFLEVRPQNASARALYQRLGFRQVGIRRAYYSDGSDALILSRHVAGTGAEEPLEVPNPPADLQARSLDRSRTG